MIQIKIQLFTKSTTTLLENMKKTLALAKSQSREQPLTCTSQNTQAAATPSTKQRLEQKRAIVLRLMKMLTLQLS